MSNTRFLFLRSSINETPRATIAYRLVEDGTRIECGFALHNPKDPWNRALGRVIAEGRLEKRNNYFFSVVHTPSNGVPTDQQIVTYLSNLRVGPEEPVWTLKLRTLAEATNAIRLVRHNQKVRTEAVSSEK